MLVVLGIAGWGALTHVGQHTPATASPSVTTHPASPAPSPTPSPSPSPTCVRFVPGFSCQMEARIQAVRYYLGHLPGSIGLVLHDRTTGAVWRSANAGVEYPMASTIKLAMMTDILQRNLAGNIHLTPADQAAMYQALYTSNDNDADALWYKYENASFLDRIHGYGMAGARFTTGVYWGDMECTPNDLDTLMNYVLTRTAPSIRNYLVYRLQHVSAIDQQWGVWGAGPENAPGNKDGWESDPMGSGHIWITNTVGFAGAGQEYTLAIMYNVGSYGAGVNGGFAFGSNALTQIAALLFQGHQTTPPTPQASAVP